MDNGEKILAWDKNITPEQEALLHGHNFREYPSIQELSAAKIENNPDNSKISVEKYKRKDKPFKVLLPKSLVQVCPCIETSCLMSSV